MLGEILYAIFEKGEGERGEEVGVQVVVCLVKNLLIFVYDVSNGRHRECFRIIVSPLGGVIMFAGDVGLKLDGACGNSR